MVSCCVWMQFQWILTGVSNSEGDIFLTSLVEISVTLRTFYLKLVVRLCSELEASPQGEWELGCCLCIDCEAEWGCRAALMRCMKTTNLKFTQLYPNQARIDLSACYWHIEGPKASLWPLRNVHTLISTQHICAGSHTLITSVCLPEKEVGAIAFSAE